ncbi:MAG TPA: aminoglycoside phosphotransferase family protein [Vicinamibacterales bacterium]|nr:aminoglycoside phosphotransferase family protein [Vicinamibacterales bacterium]
MSVARTLSGPRGEPDKARPTAELTIDADLVRRLLLEQHPDLSHLPLTLVGDGWDNAVFRLGDELAIRLPRRSATAPLMENEQRWLPELARRLPLPVPTPVRLGRPGSGFPWAWSIVRWFPGMAAFAAPPFDPRAVAIALGGFLRALHQPAPADAPHNPWRSLPLDARTKRLHEHLDQLHDTVNRERILALWDRLVVTPRWPGPPVWIHGDLHPGNLLIHDGALSAVIDFGDVTCGDPATDLSVMWMLLPPDHRGALFEAAGRNRSNELDEQVWKRARGWALAIGVAVVALGHDGNSLAQLGKKTIAAALADGAD